LGKATVRLREAELVSGHVLWRRFAEGFSTYGTGRGPGTFVNDAHLGNDLAEDLPSGRDVDAEYLGQVAEEVFDHCPVMPADVPRVLQRLLAPGGVILGGSPDGPSPAASTAAFPG